MTWLTSLSTSAILALSICSFSVISVISLLVLIKLEHGGSEIAGMTAAAYMTALGSLFAILTGFLINSEYATLRETQRTISTEVAAESVLAYASASLPPTDTARIQNLLSAYDKALITSEWRALAINAEDESTAFNALGELQLEVADLASRPYAPAAPMSSMASALETMTEARRQRGRLVPRQVDGVEGGPAEEHVGRGGRQVARRGATQRWTHGVGGAAARATARCGRNATQQRGPRGGCVVVP